MMEDLMKPRFKVIADYPNSEFVVGSIIEMDSKTTFFTGKDEWMTKVIPVTSGGQAQYCIKIFEPHPHIFKPLQWWEERKVEEMPEYVRWVKNRNEVTKVIDWDLSNPRGVCFHIVDGGYFTHYCSNAFVLPATKEEYELTKNGLLDGK